MKKIIPWRIRALLYRFAQARPINACSRQGMVSFTFDDFPKSALEIGGAILDAHDLRATYYVSVGLAETVVGAIGQMFSWGDLGRCVSLGHEIGGHTFSHVGVANLSKRDLLADIDRNRRVLARFMPNNFSYPMGQTDLSVAGMLGEHFDSCRGIEPGLNGEATDLNHLRAVSLYGDRCAARYLDLIGEARRRREWLIFYTHDIAENPSPFGCSIALFEQIVAAARASGAMVAPIRDCLAELRAASPRAPGRACATLPMTIVDGSAGERLGG